MGEKNKMKTGEKTKTFIHLKNKHQVTTSNFLIYYTGINVSNVKNKQKVYFYYNHIHGNNQKYYHEN